MVSNTHNGMENYMEGGGPVLTLPMEHCPPLILPLYLTPVHIASVEELCKQPFIKRIVEHVMFWGCQKDRRTLCKKSQFQHVNEQQYARHHGKD
mmetsp:Transcript_11617/g.18639  ORF Transcript_11617/g.18639 Transcript_11617/m.18639 type:complete len:94 (-) Transcript_11617:565-846(-)